MTLIKCYECYKEISDKAKYCPQCGAPKNVEKEGAKNCQLQEKIDSAKREFNLKEYEESQKNNTSKMSNVTKHLIISFLLLIPGVMLFTSVHSSSYTLLSIIFYYFFIAFFVFILAISAHFMFSLFNKKLSFDKIVYRCFYLAAFLYLIDITHLDLSWWIIGLFDNL